MKIIHFIFIIGLTVCLFSTGTYCQSFPIEKGKDVDLSNNAGYLRMGSLNSLNMVLDQNEIQGRNNGNASQLFINLEGGDVTMGGFTKLGRNAPGIKTKLIRGSVPEEEFLYKVNHELDEDWWNITSIDIMYIRRVYSPNEFRGFQGKMEYFNSEHIAIQGGIPEYSNYRILITYTDR